MNMHKKLKGGFTLVELLVVIVIIAALAGLTAPMVMRQRKKADQTEALNNARQIGMALLEFDTDYGRFPDADTAARVADATGTPPVTTGNNSNAYFRQLFAAGIANSESIFYAKTADSFKPDNVFLPSDPNTALEAGECGFGYILQTSTRAQSASGNPGRPVLCTPLESGSSDRFDIDPFDGRAVILKLDLSASTINVNTDGDAIMNGKSITDTGADTVWGAGGSISPTIIPPEAGS